MKYIGHLVSVTFFLRHSVEKIFNLQRNKDDSNTFFAFLLVSYSDLALKVHLGAWYGGKDQHFPSVRPSRDLRNLSGVKAWFQNWPKRHFEKSLFCQIKYCKTPSNLYIYKIKCFDLKIFGDYFHSSNVTWLSWPPFCKNINDLWVYIFTTKMVGEREKFKNFIKVYFAFDKLHWIL